MSNPSNSSLPKLQPFDLGGREETLSGPSAGRDALNSYPQVEVIRSSHEPLSIEEEEKLTKYTRRGLFLSFIPGVGCFSYGYNRWAKPAAPLSVRAKLAHWSLWLSLFVTFIIALVIVLNLLMWLFWVLLIAGFITCGLAIFHPGFRERCCALTARLPGTLLPRHTSDLPPSSDRPSNARSAMQGIWEGQSPNVAPQVAGRTQDPFY